MAWRILKQLRLHEDSEVSDVRGRPRFKHLCLKTQYGFLDISVEGPSLRSRFHYITPGRDALYCGPR
eukprot:7499027-Pyramimonas_sp.AAC.1